MWYTIYDATTGAARSITDEQPEEAALTAAGEAVLETEADPRGKIWSATTRTYSDPPPPPKLCDQRAFISLFTADEFAAIEDSADARVRYFVKLITTGSRPIVVSDPRVAGGFPLLVSLNLLTAERATAIRTALGI